MVDWDRLQVKEKHWFMMQAQLLKGLWVNGNYELCITGCLNCFQSLGGKTKKRQAEATQLNSKHTRKVRKPSRLHLRPSQAQGSTVQVAHLQGDAIYSAGLLHQNQGPNRESDTQEKYTCWKEPQTHEPPGSQQQIPASFLKEISPCLGILQRPHLRQVPYKMMSFPSPPAKYQLQLEISLLQDIFENCKKPQTHQHSEFV